MCSPKHTHPLYFPLSVLVPGHSGNGQWAMLHVYVGSVGNTHLLIFPTNVLPAAAGSTLQRFVLLNPTIEHIVLAVLVLL